MSEYNKSVEANIVALQTEFPTGERLEGIYNTMDASEGDPEKPYFYLGGPMTGIPQFNFPKFRRVAQVLRDNGYNIISPAELDDPETEKAAMASEYGAPGSGNANGTDYNDFLSRDLIIVSLPMCVGGIFLEGWQHSRGARGESWVLQFLGKQLFEIDVVFVEGGKDRPALTVIDRDRRLRELDAPVSDVPRDAPGDLTVSNAGAVEVAGDFRDPAFV